MLYGVDASTISRNELRADESLDDLPAMRDILFREVAMQFPMLTGNISITEEDGKIVIAGDPEGLRSLARLLSWLADANKERWPYLAIGKRAHIHIYPSVDISAGSRQVELMRLDAKGTGALPEGFKPAMRRQE